MFMITRQGNLTTTTNMKKLIFTLLLTPLSIFSQVLVPTHYDAQHTAEHIIRGHIKMFCEDEVKYVIEKKKDVRYVRDQVTPDVVKARLDKVLKKGKPEFVSRTNGGYIFTIAMLHPNDETIILGYITCHVDAFTQKIEEVEILKAD